MSYQQPHKPYDANLFHASLRDTFNKLCNDANVTFMRSEGMDYRSIITFQGLGTNELLYKTFFQQEMIRRGIIWNGFHQCSYSHTKRDLESIKTAYSEIIPQMQKIHESNQTFKTKIVGSVLKPVFRNMGLGQH